MIFSCLWSPMYTVYAIKSISTDRIYIGQTKNIENRLKAHNLGMSISTKKDQPWVLYAFQSVENRKEAMSLEWKIKRSKGSRLRWLKKFAINKSWKFAYVVFGRGLRLVGLCPERHTIHNNGPNINLNSTQKVENISSESKKDNFFI